MSTTPDEPTEPTQVGPAAAGFPFVSIGAPVRVGDYLVVQRLGAGGMGAVFLAEDTVLRRKVAIKAMLPDLAADAQNRERFLREARAAAAVEHDNVVPILHVGQAPDGTPFIVMPFLKGESLDDRLKRERIAPVELVLKVAREVADGLAAAHAQGLIHRDIKPANVWLEGDADAVRRCKVLDFGLARQLGAGEIELTARGAVLGTPAYMAPEQARGEPLDARADLFSLGVMLYRMATGALPFSGPTPMAVLIALTTDAAPPVGTAAPHLPPALARLIDRLMRKPAGERPQTAAEVAAEVRRIEATLHARAPYPVAVANLPDDLPASGLSGSAAQLIAAPLADEATSSIGPDPVRRPPAAPPARNRKPLLIGAAVAALALGALGVWQLTKNRGEEPAPEVVKKDEPKRELPKADPPKNDTPPKKVEPKPVEPKKVEPPAAADPDRAAALAVLVLGGRVSINDEGQEVERAADLPATPFRLTRAVLTENERVTDAGLSAFAGCKHLTLLGLSNTDVGDAGLAHFKSCTSLQYLYLIGTKVTPAGLAALDGTHLQDLDLSATAFDDKAVPQLKALTGLHYLRLAGTKVSATGAAELAKALPGCQIEHNGGTIPAFAADRKAAEWVLSIGGSVSIDDGDKPLAGKVLPKDPFRLTGVHLKANKQLSPAALAVFADCTNLTYLGLSQSNLTDDGLKHFARATKLTSLDVSLTGVSAAGLETFKNLTTLTDVYLHGANITDATLAQLARSKGLLSVHLNNTRVTDAGLAHLKACKGLTYLNLKGTRVTQAGVADFAKELPDCKLELDKNLPPGAPKADPDRAAAESVLKAGGSVHVNGDPEVIKGANKLPNEPFRLTAALFAKPVADADLAPLAGCRHLATLFLSGSEITDKGLAQVRDCVTLTSLDLSGTKVTDAGLRDTVARFTKLEDLALVGANVTEAAVKELAKAVPGCTIQWNGGTIKPMKK